MGTLHCALENGSDCKRASEDRHYRARSMKKEEKRMLFFYFARCVRKLALYSDFIHSFYWKFKMRDSVAT